MHAVDAKPIHVKSHGLSSQEKVNLFSSLFRGRCDVHALRWDNKQGRSGYSIACANEWQKGICDKPRVKCSDCQNRSFLAMDEKAIYEHLSGKQTVGLYPLLPDNNCFLLAVDFDKSDWKMDQVNLTDDESRIIAASGGDFEQAYNAQASVDSCSGLIITKHVTQATNDKLEVTPNLAALAEMESVLGKVAGLLADTGDFWFVDSRSYLRNGIWLASGSISSSCSV
jgi:hypothetical protein